MSIENLKLARAWSDTPSFNMLVVYPCLNLGEWASLLVNSQHKLDPMVGGEA